MQAVTINGVTHTWRLTARAMKKLGMAGFGDTEGLSRISTAALGEFEKLVDLVAAGLPGVDVKAIEEAVMDWTAEDLNAFFDKSEKEPAANPLAAESVSGSIGSAPGPSADTISA